MKNLIKAIACLSLLGGSILSSGCDLSAAESDDFAAATGLLCQPGASVDTYCSLNEFERELCLRLETDLPSCHELRFIREEAERAVREVFGADKDAGRGNAFKHAYWNALMTAYFGDGVAFEFGSAHENYCNIKNKGLDPSDPRCTDARVQMDLFNNTKGRNLGILHYDPDITGTTPFVNIKVVKDSILFMVEDGELRALVKGGQGLVPTSSLNARP